MAKFKQVPQTFLLKKFMGFWMNLAKNYGEAVRDVNFFDILNLNFDHDKAVELIETAFSRGEIEEMQNAGRRSSCLDFDDPLGSICQSIWNNERVRGKFKAVVESMHDCIVESARPSGVVEPLERRFRELKRLLKLSDLESEILILAYVKSQTFFEWPCRVEDREKPLYYAMALDRSYAEVSKAMTAKGNLRKFDLLDNSWDFNCCAIGGYMDGTDDEALARRFYTKSEDKDILPWEFFGELSAKDGEILKRMVNASGGKCNILLYGEPGTGKTSFARSLAKELGRTAWEIRQGDENGRNMKSESRMAGIHVCNGQESPAEGIMIVDEADELLRGTSRAFGVFGFDFGGGKSTEKGVMNSILDDMKLPAVWISNAPAEAMDESVRRRFDYSICFERLSGAQRAAIWRNQVAKHGMQALIPERKIAEYAAKYETSAGGISTVLANVGRMASAPDQVDELIATLMKPHCKLMGVKDANAFLPAKDYSLDGLNIKGKVTLERVVKAAANYMDSGFGAASEDKPRMNILLYGPPGTGKTEFVKYLGKALDRRVLAVKGSDMLGMYVGESEKNIAEAFRRAEAERAILFFDEVDGLLQDRSNASHSWEVTQVNELLQQMESFDGIMVAATNFSKNLDPATMRRFTFKLEFGYLEDEGKKAFFERMFKTTLTDEECAELHLLRNLAPGDFRTVRQEQFYLGDSVTNKDRIEALKEECAVKKDGAGSAPIGFAA